MTDLAVGLNITHTDGVGTFCITDASSQTVTWHFASYKAYSDVVLNHAPLANHYKDNVVQDYAKWVNVFCDYITKETLLSKSFNEETGDLTIIVMGKTIGKNKVIINDYSFDFEVRSLWLGGED